MSRRAARRLPVIAALRGLLTACCLCAATSACDGIGLLAGEQSSIAEVVMVLDGDSLIVRTGTGRERELRLAGIDAPERRQPHSNEARAALRQMVLAEAVRVEVIERDRYGREVARVTRLRDQLPVNAEMVKRGHAWVYRRYQQSGALDRLEQTARAGGRGLWGLPEDERVAPWEWRTAHPRRRNR